MVMKVGGSETNNMVITWKLLRWMNCNSPRFGTVCSGALRGCGGSWQEQIVSDLYLLVSNTSVCVLSKIKVQVINIQNKGSKPQFTIGYSREDYP